MRSWRRLLGVDFPVMKALALEQQKLLRGHGQLVFHVASA